VYIKTGKNHSERTFVGDTQFWHK